MKLPAHVLFRKDLSLMLWKPHGILDEGIVNEIVAFIDVAEERASKPFNRFADLSALDMVDLNFKLVFHIALHRRLALRRIRRSSLPFMSQAPRLLITPSCTRC